MNKKGFTLIEILFALTIVGIVAAVSITGLKANITQHELDAYSKKALHAYSSAIYEVMNAPNAPDNFRCQYALEYISQGTITGDTSINTYTTGDGMQWTCTTNKKVTVTYPDNAGSCQIVTKLNGVVQGGTCGNLDPNNMTEENDPLGWATPVTSSGGAVVTSSGGAND